MQALDPIAAVEAAMARLMPPALSQDGQFEIEAMLDELAGSEANNITAIRPNKWLARCLIGGGIAAGIGALCALFPMLRNSPESQVAVNAPSAEGLVLVSQSDRIESMTDDGWHAQADGSAMRVLRLKTVQENNVRDAKSGMIVQISEPREETLQVPASELPRVSKPGEEVVISTFRAGKPLQVKLKLGASPLPQKPFTGEMVEAAILPTGSPSPARVANFADKAACFANAEGRAVVSHHGDAFNVKITGPQAQSIFTGELSGDEPLNQVPENWRGKIKVLCRTLDQALDAGLTPERQPQPRVTPPVSDEP